MKRRTDSSLEGGARIALATCAEVPGLDEDGPPLVEALARRGIAAAAAVWDDVGVDWGRFDLVVVRSTWDYAERRDRFLAWAEALPRVLNPLDVLRWNTDKRYLAELQGMGVPVVPTTFLEPDDSFAPPAGRFVVKPAVSAGSRNSASYEPSQVGEAGEHVRRLQRERRTVMVQPYLEEVDDHGETALVYLGGNYSHAVRKEALLPPGQPPGQALYLEETIHPREATTAERAVGDLVMASVPFESSDLLYGRVDLVPGPDGQPLLLELELAEPSLFLGCCAGAFERFAELIGAALRGPAARRRGSV